MKRKRVNTSEANNIFIKVKSVENNLHETNAKLYVFDFIPLKMSYNWRTESLVVH